MSQRIELFSKNPDSRLLGMITSALKEGAVIAYPTDSGFALGCLMGKKLPLLTSEILTPLALCKP